VEKPTLERNAILKTILIATRTATLPGLIRSMAKSGLNKRKLRFLGRCLFVSPLGKIPRNPPTIKRKPPKGELTVERKKIRLKRVDEMNQNRTSLRAVRRDQIDLAVAIVTRALAAIVPTAHMVRIERHVRPAPCALHKTTPHMII